MGRKPQVVEVEGEAEPGRSAKKHRAILDAATGVFLAGGYLGASMDEIAALSAVSKQTVYKHFASKEALFIEVVTAMTRGTGDLVHEEMPDFAPGGDAAAYLASYAYRQLLIVLTPRVMQLRRLVIGEVSRFPELARALYEFGPQRAIGELTDVLGALAAAGAIEVTDARTAATQFNWLVMAAPLNDAMLLGDAAIPAPDELRHHATEAVRLFLRAHQKR